MPRIEHKEGSWFVTFEDEGQDIYFKFCGDSSAKEVAEHIVTAFKLGQDVEAEVSEPKPQDKRCGTCYFARAQQTTDAVTCGIRLPMDPMNGSLLSSTHPRPDCDGWRAREVKP